MQSVKKIIAIAVCLFSAGAFAEPSTALPFPMATDVTKGTSSNKPTPDTSTNVAVGKDITETNTISEDNTVSDGRTSQEFLKEVVENDYDYQLKSRKLSQEVELEKMRSEIRKLRGEDKKTGAVAASRPQPSAPQADAPKQPESKIPRELPIVLLESEIAGNARVAVTNSQRNKLMYVRPGERFEMEGARYQLVRDKKQGLVVKGAEE